MKRETQKYEQAVKHGLGSDIMEPRVVVPNPNQGVVTPFEGDKQSFHRVAYDHQKVQILRL